MATTEVTLGITTATVQVRTHEDVYDNRFETVEFIGQTEQAVCAAAAAWCGDHAAGLITRIRLWRFGWR
ncbi:hypothetical protein [Amycolatopsis australiensis]|uniref:Uncharacterized protein n=1 Tax=Amycolatopsis australiensis TaxID=546364 RepID=A0A1K1LM04_9PSEU|nr:hypothetical protein [Amycolatopsis australiensis]SFW11929.1 hypothetical protein SAMN04489730_0072 [Amycolatopsis australiensis]